MFSHTARIAAVRFGRRVRARRRAAGMTQVELERRSRVGSKFISEIERGTTNPSLETMVLVADALGCDVVDLLLPDNSSTPVSLRAAATAKR